jgi:ADP-ribose pyrophosphatase YjhB (NUDIX family)
MLNPNNSVRIVLFDEANAEFFFAITESDDTENWKLPGGKFGTNADGSNESPEQAAARELGEEVGLSADEVSLHYVTSQKNEDGQSMCYIFSGKIGVDGLKPSTEVSKSRWFTDRTVPECKNRDHILTAVAEARK